MPPKNILHKVLLANLSEAYRTAKHLSTSKKRISHLMPLTGNILSKLSEEDMEKLDAFRVRFCDLQDCVGNKVFRALLGVELEKADTMLDVINKFEKRRIIPSVEVWKTLRDIRNLFSHDYPDSDEKRAEVLKLAYENTTLLLEILDAVKMYVLEHDLLTQSDVRNFNIEAG